LILTHSGGTPYNVTITRLYKDGSIWTDSSELRPGRTSPHKVLDLAHMGMFEESNSEPAKAE
jgi:hypothetical protein